MTALSKTKNIFVALSVTEWWPGNLSYIPFELGDSI